MSSHIPALVLGVLSAGCAGSPCVERTFFADRDGDGWGDGAITVEACAAPEGGSARAGDCDDGDPGRHPEVAEACDGVDQDCDGLVDDRPEPARFVDADGDGYGDPERPLPGCDAWGVEDATDCDDADPGLHPSTPWFADADGDGSGDVEVGRGCEPPEPAAVRVGGDCDDADPDRHPFAVERCDGVDQDCLGAVEGPETWAFPELSVRIPLTVEPVAGSTVPLAVDLDLGAALAALDLAGPVATDSLRLAVQGCGTASGERELPAQWLDRVGGLLAAGNKADPVGDEVGALVALWDPDGDAATVEPWPRGPIRLALYLQGPPAPASFAGDLVVSPTSLAAGQMSATFDPGAGGLLASLEHRGRPVGSQAEAARGNGVLTPSGPLSAQDVPGILEIVDQGPVTAAIRASALLESPSGSLRSATTYRVFAGREALLVTPELVTASSLSITGATDRAEPIRPFELALPPGATCASDPALVWADASTPEVGLTWAWVAEPRWLVALGCDGAETWSSANDLEGGAPGMGTEGTVPTGTPVADEPVAVFLPHGRGGAAVAAAEREAWRAPVVPTVGEPETWRR